MVRPKGGRSQPRYYYLKEAGEQRLISYLTGKYIRKNNLISTLNQTRIEVQTLIEHIQLQFMAIILMRPQGETNES